MRLNPWAVSGCRSAREQEKENPFKGGNTVQQIQRYFRKAGKAVLRFFGRVAHGSVLDIAILVCGVGLVGVGTTMAVVSAQRPQQVPVDVSSTVPVSVSASVSTPPVEQELYDPNENALQLSE